MLPSPTWLPHGPLYSLSLFIIFLFLLCLSLSIRFISIFQLALDCHGDVDDGDRPPGANSRGRRRLFRAAAAWLPPVRRARRRAFIVCPHGGGSSCSALRRFVSSLGYVEELMFLRPNRRTEGASRQLTCLFLSTSSRDSFHSFSDDDKESLVYKRYLQCRQLPSILQPNTCSLIGTVVMPPQSITSKTGWVCAYTILEVQKPLSHAFSPFQ